MSNSRGIKSPPPGLAADPNPGPVSKIGVPCQYSTAAPPETSPTPGSRAKIRGAAGRVCAALAWTAIACFTPGCLLVNRGSQNPATMVLAVVGFFLLYMGLRFFLGRLEQGSETPAVFRFLGGVLAGLVIFLA